jgi:hypothetical protein
VLFDQVLRETGDFELARRERRAAGGAFPRIRRQYAGNGAREARAAEDVLAVSENRFK